MSSYHEFCKINQLERELAAAKAEAKKWEKLHDADTAHLVSEQLRDNYGPTETLNETAIRLSRELTEVRKMICEMEGGARETGFELYEWKTLQTWGGTPQIVDEFIKGQQSRIHAAQDAEKQRDALAEALERYMRASEKVGHSPVAYPDEWRALCLAATEAETALAAVKGGKS